MSKSIITIIILIIAAILIVWWVRFSSQGSSLTSNSTIQLVEKLQKITIDPTFFNDTQFVELESVPKPSLENVQKGRKNPFTPIASQVRR